MLFIAEKGFAPDGWEKANVLRGCISLKQWTPQLNSLLEAASQDLPSYTGSEGIAMAYLALHKAGRLDILALLERFPVSFEGYYVGAPHDREAIAKALEDLRTEAPKAEGKKLSRIIQALRSDSRKNLNTYKRKI